MPHVGSGSSGAVPATHSKNIFADILRRDEEAKLRRRQQEMETIEFELARYQRSRACALQHSVTILTESTDKQIQDIFTTLKSCVQGKVISSVLSLLLVFA